MKLNYNSKKSGLRMAVNMSLLVISDVTPCFLVPLRATHKSTRRRKPKTITEANL
jgi:hypothetical protein